MADAHTSNQSTQPDQRCSWLKDFPDRLPSCRMHILFWSVAVTAFALDLLTKWAVFQWLQGRSYVPVIDNVVRLVMVYNNGAAFGLFSGHPNWLVAVSLVALVVIIGIFLFGGSKEKIMHIATAFFAAGICGNLYDRLSNHGMVRDFIDVGITDNLRWPAFNLADSLLCVAVGLMMISLYITDKPCRKRAPQRKQAP